MPVPTSVVSIAAIAVVLTAGGVSADGPEARAVIEKAIQAIGGEKRLSALEGKVVQTTQKGKLYHLSRGEDFTEKSIVQGLNHFQRQIEGRVGGIPSKIEGGLAGNKAWRKFAIWTGSNWQQLKEPATRPEHDILAEHRQIAYLHWVPAVILPLKGKSFRVESTREERVGGKSAVALTVMAPDQKKFELFFDEKSGLPVKTVARVVGAYGDEYTLETTILEYKSLDGIKWATRGETRRDGQKVTESEITEFKILDRVDPKTFAKPAAE
jgi:hypothetical protein